MFVVKIVEVRIFFLQIGSFSVERYAGDGNILFRSLPRSVKDNKLLFCVEISYCRCKTVLFCAEYKH
jgi:hypothetical protein